MIAYNESFGLGMNKLYLFPDPNSLITLICCMGEPSNFQTDFESLAILEGV